MSWRSHASQGFVAAMEESGIGDLLDAGTHAFNRDMELSAVAEAACRRGGRRARSRSPHKKCRCRVILMSGKSVNAHGKAEVQALTESGQGEASVAIGKNKVATIIANCGFQSCSLRDKFYDMCQKMKMEDVSGSCMIKGTLISTPGGLVPVEELTEGHIVTGLGGTDQRVMCVVQTFLGNRPLMSINGGPASFTPEHVFRASSGNLVCHDHEQLGRERFLLNLDDVQHLEGSRLETSTGVMEITDVTMESAASDTPVYEVVLENAWTKSDGTYYANGLPCASSFPEVVQNFDFFKILSNLAMAFPAKEYTWDYAGHAAMMSAAVDVVKENVLQLNRALVKPSFGSRLIQQLPANVADHLFKTLNAWRGSQTSKSMSTVMFYLYMASGFVLAGTSKDKDGEQVSSSAATLIAAS